MRNADADTVSDCLSTVLRTIQRGRPALISKSQLLTLRGHFMQGCAFKQKVSANPSGCGPDLSVEPDDCSSTQLFKIALNRTQDEGKLNQLIARATDQIMTADVSTGSNAPAKISRPALLYSVEEAAFVSAGMIETPANCRQAV